MSASKGGLKLRTPKAVGSLLATVVLASLASACGGKTDRPPVVTSDPGSLDTAETTPEPPAPRPPQPTPPMPPVDTGEDLVRSDDPAGISGMDLVDLNEPGREFLEDVFFGFDSASLDGAARAILDEHARTLNQYPDMKVLIEGHCDERGTVEYNLALGERRANQVYNYLMSLGIASNRMRTITYGKEFPIDPGHNEQAWTRNRRGRFEITEK